MATLENNVETIPCRHCGSPVRQGMIRCRECRGLLVESGDEFTLSPQVAAAAQPKCARCGMPLEPGVDDCPSCASALLDDLLKGPAEIASPPAAPPRASNSTSELRPRQAGSSTPPASGSWTPLRELAPANSDPASGNPAVADTAARERQPQPVAKKTDSARPGSGQSPQKGAAAGKSSGSAKKLSTIDDDPPGLFGDDDEDSAPAKPPRTEAAKPAPAARSVAAEEDSSSGAIETSAACAALLASLASADATLRVEIATALGKLGDKAAMGPLERHMVDQDIRVRRAVATALVQLGHEKGETLLDIADRRPAHAVLTMAKGSPTPKPKRTSGGMEIDGDMVKKLGVAIVAIAVAAGGYWYFMGGGSTPAGRRTKKSTKAKSAATKKVPAAPAPSAANQD